jgi:hypothetical protein
MNLPDRVNLDLRQRERDNDDAEEYFAINRDSMIEEEVYRLEKSFDLDDMIAAFNTAPIKLQMALYAALSTSDPFECLTSVEDIRDAWIKQKATDIVENA